MWVSEGDFQLVYPRQGGAGHCLSIHPRQSLELSRSADNFVLWDMDSIYIVYTVHRVAYATFTVLLLPTPATQFDFLRTGASRCVAIGQLVLRGHW